MTATSPDVDALVASIADGDNIDWTALEAQADDDVRRLLAHLQHIATVGNVHRTLDAEDVAAATQTASSPARGAASLGDLGRWGHLQLVRKVGEGSYGEVYHARDTWLDHPVALKLLRADLSDRVSPTRLLDEARVLVKVRHPNVVAVHGADLQQGRVGFWMEFVQGQRLDDLVAFEGLLGADDAAQIGQELCGALAAVHEAGLVHRDVKAQNVIREAKGRAVLMDFGAGQLMADAGQGGGAGTPLYLAPEMFRGVGASVQTDIYALGVLLYYLLTASFPVVARSIEELKAAHAAGGRTPLHEARPGLPRALTNVIEKMLAADPAERYTTAADALTDLQTFTSPASFMTRAGVWTGRTATTIAIITILGLLNTATFNLLLGRTGEFNDEQSIAAWFRWGLGSLLAPLVYIGVGALTLTVVAGGVTLLRRLWTRLDRLFTEMTHRSVEFAAERGLDDPTAIFQLTVVAGAIALAALFWGFWDYGAGFLAAPMFVDHAPHQRLAALQPANEFRADIYGWLLDGLLLVYGIALTRTFRWADRVNAPIRLPRAAGLLVPALAVLMWQLPYRLVYQNAFARVDLSAARCYELGQANGRLLLYCPDADPPRNQVVSTDDSRLHRRGVVESIFLPLDGSQPTR